MLAQERWIPPKITYGPPHTGRRIRIKNRARLILAILFLSLAFLLIFIPATGTGQGNLQPYTVGYGETYWSIAQGLQTAGYKPKADIRSVVHDLVKQSGISAHELQAGDTILIPEVDVNE